MRMATTESTERVFFNARIWTGDVARPAAAALHARGERIIRVGEDSEVLAGATQGAARIDLQGRRVVPGFIDAHSHFTTGTAAGLYNVGDVVELQRRVAALAAATPGDSWLHDGGWAYAEFPEGVPHRRYLDEVVPDRPVWLTARDGHMGLANSLALELAGLHIRSADPAKGRIVRDARGDLTGELTGLALYAVQDLIPPPTVEECEAQLAVMLKVAATCGITSLQNLQGWSVNELEAVARTCRAGRSSARLYASVWLDTAPGGARSAPIGKRLASEFPTLLRFGGAKAVLDGTIDAGTAAMRAPLSTGATGFSYFTQARLNALVARAEKRGQQVMLHACGDAAIGQALTAFEHAAAVNRELPRGRRHASNTATFPKTATLPACAHSGSLCAASPTSRIPTTLTSPTTPSCWAPNGRVALSRTGASTRPASCKPSAATTPFRQWMCYGRFTRR